MSLCLFPLIQMILLLFINQTKQLIDLDILINQYCIFICIFEEITKNKQLVPLFLNKETNGIIATDS